MIARREPNPAFQPMFTQQRRCSPQGFLLPIHGQNQTCFPYQRGEKQGIMPASRRGIQHAIPRSAGLRQSKMTEGQQF